MFEIMKFTEAIHQALDQLMRTDDRVFLMGLGASYPNGIDGTSGDLKQKYPDRVFDTPVSEATTTGVAVGAATEGMRPIIHHGRVEFALFAADQIITQASKWRYMFGDNASAPAVFRIAVGRQWGNGPQHSQTLFGLFGGAPGLRVVVPSTPDMAKRLLISAVKEPDPVVYIEQQWVIGNSGPVNQNLCKWDLNRARDVYGIPELSNVTLVSYGDGLIESVKAAKILRTLGVYCHVIDLVSLNPIDYDFIFDSISYTGALVAVDTTNNTFSVGSEIISKVAQDCFEYLKGPPVHVAAPHVPCPTATELMRLYYPTHVNIVTDILAMFGKAPIPSLLPPTDDEVNNRPTEVLDF